MRISQNNIKGYITEQALPKFPYLAKYIAAEEVKRHTYVNNIWRITLESNKKGRHDVYLRQALDHIKADPEAKVPPQRIFYEFAVLKRLSVEIFANFDYEVTPKPYLEDKENFIIILSDVRKGSPILVDELSDGRIHPETGENLGKVLATLHSKTWGIETFELDKEGNEKQLKRHFYNRLEQAQEKYPELTEKLIEKSSRATTTFVAGDFASKNIFIHPDKTISFVDLERSFVGDPAFDIGFLLGHYQIAVLQNSRLEKDYKKLLKAFKINYSAHLGQPKETTNEILKRSDRFIGAIILYRLYSRAKSGEINKKSITKLRDFAYYLLQS